MDGSIGVGRFSIRGQIYNFQVRVTILGGRFTIFSGYLFFLVVVVVVVLVYSLGRAPLINPAVVTARMAVHDLSGEDCLVLPSFLPQSPARIVVGEKFLGKEAPGAPPTGSSSLNQ